MKNLIIAILSTIIFYTQFCVIKMPVVMPVFTLVVWVLLCGVDEFMEEYMKSVRRGMRLQNHLKRIRR